MQLIKLEDLHKLPPDFKFGPVRELTPEEKKEMLELCKAEFLPSDWDHFTEEDLEKGRPLQELIDMLDEIIKQRLGDDPNSLGELRLNP